MSSQARLDRYFEEWMKYVERRAPEVAQALRAVEVFRPHTTRAIFDQAFAQGENYIENIRAREARAREE
jgi:hypothetical protein